MIAPRTLIRPLRIDDISGEVVDAAMKVHSALGPALLEKIYLDCLAYELRSRGLHVAMQVPVPIVYEGVSFSHGFRIDLLVENAVIVEIKVAKQLSPVHEAQLLSYLALSGLSVGLLINFFVAHLRDGIKRKISRRRATETA
jgi:GxxExxY protein